ncbi:MAG TPA: transglutaminase family protein [Acidimicrobiales bacterium]|nr:transglutaminase family protein [Acidimicrobiales bacterium]
MTPSPTWRVGCELGFDVTDPATVVLQIAPATSAGDLVEERLDVALDGQPVDVELLVGDHGTRVHVLRSPIGTRDVRYQAGGTAAPTGAPAPPPAVDPAPAPHVTTALDTELLTYLRPSRYCPSDQLSGFAAYELGHLPVGPALLEAVGDWVASRLTYVPGSSGPLDSAVDSLFAGRGVCRDFAHLAITVLRALEVPARLVSAYAPGLTPMDFHAVVEAHVDGRWQILDPTRLAPRPSLLRVATGRDATDTAFITVLGGDAELVRTEVTAVIDGDLPVDDHRAAVALA